MPDPETPAPSSVPDAAIGEALHRSPVHILVVDDEPHIGRIIKTRLEQGNFAVTVVDSGTEALAELERDAEISLLVLDLMLPGMSGLDVLRAVRANARLQHLKCIVLTAAGQDAQFRQAQQLGISEFMTKPFSPRRLFAHVVALSGAGSTTTGALPSPVPSPESES